MANLPMFLPLGESTTGAVFLPGLAGDPHPERTPTMFPPGTYPIMGSGDYQGTLYPLADPVPPRPTPLPPEVPPVALPQATTIPVPPLEGPMQPELIGAQPLPTPQAIPLDAAPLQGPMPYEALPIPPGQGPGPLSMDSLAGPLPTSVAPHQMPWPPFPMPIPAVHVPGPATPMLPDVPTMGPQAMGLPGVELTGPIPGPDAAEPIALTQKPGMAALLDALSTLRDQQAALRQQGDERNTLKAGIPQTTLGNVIWEQSWGSK